jgi:hypothetical protein
MARRCSDAATAPRALALALLLAAAGVPSAAADGGGGSVRRVDGWIVIEAVKAPRLALAQELAAVTRSRLLEAPERLAATGAITLSWRGRHAGEAWARVLGDEVNHARHCTAQACRVWILGPAAAARVGPAPGRQPEPRDNGIDPPGLFPSR